MFTVPGRPQTNSPRFRIRPSRSNDIVTHGIRQPFITRPTLRVTDTIPRYQVNSRAWKPPRDSPRVYRGTTWFSRGEVYNRLKHRGGLSENWRTLGREKRGFCSMNFLELRRIDWPVRWLGCKGDWIDYLGGFGRGRESLETVNYSLDGGFRLVLDRWDNWFIILFVTETLSTVEFLIFFYYIIYRNEKIYLILWRYAHIFLSNFRSIFCTLSFYTIFHISHRIIHINPAYIRCWICDESS